MVDELPVGLSREANSSPMRLVKLRMTVNRLLKS